MQKQKITEEMKIHEEWYKEARDMTLKRLPAFLEKLMEHYQHDYGTICHAMAAGAVATCWAMNGSGQGNITGFQAGAVMWQFIKRWMSEDGPLRLISYRDMLYPQYGDKYEKTITKDTFEWLQKEAQKELSDKSNAHPAIVKHWQEIVNGKVPFGYIIKV